MSGHIIRIRPLSAMISVVRTQTCVDGSCLRCEIWIAVTQLDDDQPVEICEARSLLPCASDLTDAERAAALRELARDLRSRASSDPRYATRRLPEAA
jgi:hypothetical protein